MYNIYWCFLVLWAALTTRTSKLSH